MRGFGRLTLMAIEVAAVLLGATAARGQERRVRALVDYIAGANVYVSAGQAQGLFAGDTLQAFGAAAGARIGMAIVVSSTRTRAVLEVVGRAFPVTRGGELWLEIGEAAAARLAVESAARDSVRAETPTPAVVPVRSVTRAQPNPRFEGRIAFEVDARRTSTRWGDEPTAHTHNSLATPALRLRLLASELPGELRFETTLRAAYRYSSENIFEPAQSLRIYDANLGKDFRVIPLQVRAGRFHTPYESYSGYWDGLLVRTGGSGIGLGLAAGYTPRRGNEGFTTELPKATAFLDYHARSKAVRYDGDVSFHRQRLHIGGNDRMAAGWSQRLSVNQLRFTQRLELREAPDGALTLSQLHLSGSAPIADGLTLNARYSTNRPLPVSAEGLTKGTRRDRIGAGLSFTGTDLIAGLDATRLRSGLDRRGNVLSASLHVPRTGVLGLGIGGSASVWRDGEFRSLYLAPSLSRSFGRTQARAGFQMYRTERGDAVTSQGGGELYLSFPLARGAQFSVAADARSGGGLSSQRIVTTIWAGL